MIAALRRIDPDPEQGGTPSRREPSTAVRRKPSLTLVSCNPNKCRLTTDTYAGQEWGKGMGKGDATLY